MLEWNGFSLMPQPQRAIRIHTIQAVMIKFDFTLVAAWFDEIWPGFNFISKTECLQFVDE